MLGRDTGQRLASDRAGESAEAFRTAAVASVRRADTTGAIDLGRSNASPEQIVQVLTDVSNGLKYSLCDAKSYRDRLGAALRLVDATVRKPRTRPWQPPVSAATG